MKFHNLQQFPQRIKKRFSSRALILMYHGVADVSIDPWGLYVSPQRFAEHLEVLQQLAQPIGLPQLVQAHQAGTVPDRSVAITFDDGYANNLHHAKPLLEQTEIPATVFVSTGYVGHSQEGWWDRLAQALLKPGELPETLRLTMGGAMYQWELGTAKSYSKVEAQQDQGCRPWDAIAGSRLEFYYRVWQFLRPLMEIERSRLVDEVVAWAGTQPQVRSTHRMLSLEELQTLATGNLVEIGAHTATHPLLSAQPESVQRGEIESSKRQLERLIDRPVESFAYPFGGYTSSTAALVEEIGFQCACTLIEDVVWQESHSFQLPRITMQDWSKEEFTQLLKRCFHL